LFYEKSGFVAVKTEDIDIGSGYFMNDYVMEKRLVEMENSELKTENAETNLKPE
jgi:hypothetical protein